MFEQVYGHLNARKILQNMLKKNNLPNAFCFYGVEGIGKRRIARELAQAMFCETKTACGHCAPCSKFLGNHLPDYMELEPDGREIKVQPIREITEQLHYKPFESDYRIFLIDQAESMNDGAANAFLKSLEEPPPYVYFFLITSNLEKLLPTIRSRCQKLSFQPLSDQDKEKILIHSFHLDEKQARDLARISYRQLETGPEAWDEFVANVDFILDFFNLMVQKSMALDFCSEKLRKKESLLQFFDHFLACLREGMLVSAGRDPSPVFQPWKHRLEELTRNVPTKYWIEAMDDFLYMLQNRNRNLNWGYWFNQFSTNALGIDQNTREKHRDWLVKKGIFSRG